MGKRSSVRQNKPSQELISRISEEADAKLTIQQLEALQRIVTDTELTAQRVCRILKAAGYIESLAGGKAKRIAACLNFQQKKPLQSTVDERTQPPHEGVARTILDSLVHDPDESTVRFLLSDSGIFTSDLRDSFKVTITRPSAPGARTRLGLEYLQLERFEEAYACFYKAIKMDRQDVHAYFGVAQVDAVQGHHGRARMVCDMLLECELLDTTFRHAVEDFLETLPEQDLQGHQRIQRDTKAQPLIEKAELHMQNGRWLQAVQFFLRASTSLEADAKPPILLRIAQAFLGEARQENQQPMYNNAYRYFCMYRRQGGSMTDEIQGNLQECEQALEQE